MKLAMAVQIICFRISLQSCYQLVLLFFPKDNLCLKFSTKIRLRLLLYPSSEEKMNFVFPERLVLSLS